MEFEEVLKARRSVRKFKDKVISDEEIGKLLEYANLSPSAGNLQARKVVVVKNVEIKKKLAAAARGQAFVSEAPIVFVVLADPEASEKKYGERGETLFAVQDATIFASYLQLAATDLGFTSCWVGTFKEKEVQKILGVPAQLRAIAIIPVGYPAETPERTPRKDVSEITGYIEE